MKTLSAEFSELLERVMEFEEESGIQELLDKVEELKQYKDAVTYMCGLLNADNTEDLVAKVEVLSSMMIQTGISGVSELANEVYEFKEILDENEFKSLEEMRTYTHELSDAEDELFDEINAAIATFKRKVLR